MQAIICPHCKKEVEITSALQSEVISQIQEKYKEEIEKARLEEKEKVQKVFNEEMELRLKDMQSEKKQKEERIDKLMHDLLKTNEEMRELKRKDEERELENQKTLQEEREKLKEEVTKLVEEKAKLQVLELSKKLDDTQKALIEAQKKSQQTSQQLQGEVLELELEQSLRSAFPDDLIEPVQKGVRGADLRQIVRTARQTVCGTILWEFKRTKQWSEEWISKLKDDLRAEKAHVPIIVSEALPKEAENGFGNKNGVWICSLPLVLPIAEMIRQQLIAVARERFILQNKANKTKAEELYEYVASHEFKQQIESLVEIYQEMSSEILKERAAFEKIWKTREVQVMKLFKSATGVAGSLHGIVGTSFQVKGLELTELESGK